jgi:hypothetical protein
MLAPMDVPASAAAPWVVLGVVTGLALAALLGLLVVLLRRRRRSPPRPTVPPGWTDDDLPRFREAPPGSPGAPVPPASGWVSLAPVPPPAAVPAPDPAPGLLVGLCATALLLVGAAAAVAALAHEPAEAPRATGQQTAPPPADGGTITATFDGLVLERRAVGVTATYPSIELTASGNGDALAFVTLPAWNCLADEVPDDPEAAGCAETTSEYAELRAPALQVEPDGDTLRFSGRFPTFLRPNGTPPERTGRIYELSGWISAGGHGELRLGDDTARAVDVRRAGG